MKFEGIVETLLKRAKASKKTIVLPESEDIRVLQAASYLLEHDIATIILIGKEDKIANVAREAKVDISAARIICPETSEKKEAYQKLLWELRKHKGMTEEQASQIVLDPVYFATLMVKAKDADGMVSGAVHSTADTLRPALQIIKQKENIKTVSSFFLLETKNKEMGADGTFLFADCGLIEFPTEEQLVDITKESAQSFHSLTMQEPKVALLSYSTMGSAKGEAIDKMKNVLHQLQEENVSFDVDGELQTDAAIVPEVAALKAPNSKVAGKANVLIFPNLEAGNIGYKLAQRFGNTLALGPITQGLQAPINDLSRGCVPEDIVGVVAITCMQAQQNISKE